MWIHYHKSYQENTKQNDPKSAERKIVCKICYGTENTNRARTCKCTLKAAKNQNIKILDIGCGRGKIIGSLSSQLKLKNRPTGIDLVNLFKSANQHTFHLKDLVLVLVNLRIH